MIRKSCFLVLSLFVFAVFLTGCPKKIPEPVISEKEVVTDPIAKLFEAFSAAESLQAGASIRIDTVRNGEEMFFLLNGFLLYQKPNLLRLQGYHPFGMGLFDALYRNGEFFLLIPPQKRAYTGEVSQMEELKDRAGVIQILVEKNEGNGIPRRIQIELVEKETRIDLKLKDVVINPVLPGDSFDWVVPQGVKVRSLERLLKEKKIE